MSETEKVWEETWEQDRASVAMVYTGGPAETRDRCLAIFEDDDHTTDDLADYQRDCARARLAACAPEAIRILLAIRNLFDGDTPPDWANEMDKLREAAIDPLLKKAGVR